MKNTDPKKWFQKVLGLLAVILGILGFTLLQIPPTLSVTDTDILRKDDPFSMVVTIKNTGLLPASIVSTKCVFEDHTKLYKLPWGREVPIRGEYTDTSERILAGGKTTTTPCQAMSIPRSPKKGIYNLHIEYEWLLQKKILEERYVFAVTDSGPVWLPENDKQ